MFKNTGKTIKTLAKILFWLFACIPVLFAIPYTPISDILYESFEELMDIEEGLFMVINIVMIMPIGILTSWVAASFLYGFGELIDNSKILAERANKESL